MRPNKPKLMAESLDDINREQLAAMKEPAKVAVAARNCRVSRRTLQRWIAERRITKVCGRVDAAQVRACVDELYNVPRRGPRPGTYQPSMRLGKTKEPQKRLTDADRIAIIGHHITKIQNDWAFLQVAEYVVARAKGAMGIPPSAPSGGNS